MGILMRAMHSIMARRLSEKVQYEVQRERENGNNKNFRELIEEELQKELSIEPLKED